MVICSYSFSYIDRAILFSQLHTFIQAPFSMPECTHTLSHSNGVIILRHADWRSQLVATQLVEDPTLPPIPQWYDTKQARSHAISVFTNVLTNSWHHTQRFPAKVLIFLLQTSHLLAPQSALIQSWAGIWDAEEARNRHYAQTAT